MGPQAQLQGHGKKTGGMSVREQAAIRIQVLLDSDNQIPGGLSRTQLRGTQRVLRQLDAIPEFNGLGQIAAHLRSVPVILRVIRWGREGGLPCQGGEFCAERAKLQKIYIEDDAKLMAIYGLIASTYDGKPQQGPTERYDSLVQEITDSGHIPTSPEIAAKMALIAGIDPGERVLVPCGGIGPLVQSALDREAGFVHSIEMEHRRHQAMSLRFSEYEKRVRLSRENFMNWHNPDGLFDIVLICPPEFDVNANILRAWRSVRGPKEEVGKKPEEWVTGGLVALLSGLPRDHEKLFLDLRDRGASRQINVTVLPDQRLIIDAWRDS